MDLATWDCQLSRGRFWTEVLVWFDKGEGWSTAGVKVAWVMMGCCSGVAGASIKWGLKMVSQRVNPGVVFKNGGWVWAEVDGLWCWVGLYYGSGLGFRLKMVHLVY